MLCLLDSVTRLAQAQREIGLAAGEPATARSYTPSVFAELPALLERAGPGSEGQGDITGIFTVLVDGDDHDEPVADAVRGILDGHLVFDRRIGERGRWPAVDVLRSVSRALPRCHAPEENQLLAEARNLISAYEGMADMIRLGAYRTGSDPLVDQAILKHRGVRTLSGTRDRRAKPRRRRVRRARPDPRPRADRRVTSAGCACQRGVALIGGSNLRTMPALRSKHAVCGRLNRSLCSAASPRPTRWNSCRADDPELGKVRLMMPLERAADINCTADSVTYVCDWV